MDDSQFDRLTRLAAQPRSRRGALGVLAGLAGLGLGEASARKRRGKARAHAADTGKTTICHHDQDAGVYVKITVADAAWPSHLRNHGGRRLPTRLSVFAVTLRSRCSRRGSRRR